MVKQFTLGSYIRSLRTRKQMTQAQLAKKLNVTDKAVSKWERDISYPDIAQFPKLADILGLDVNVLLNEIMDREQPSGLVRFFERSRDCRMPVYLILGCADLAANQCADRDVLLKCLGTIRISGKYLLRAIGGPADTAGSNGGGAGNCACEGDFEELENYLKEQHLDGLLETMKLYFR